MVQIAVASFTGGQSGQPTDSSSDRSSDKRDLDQAYAGHGEEDEVRLPDQVKRQKLVDTDAYLGRRKRNMISVYCTASST